MLVALIIAVVGFPEVILSDREHKVHNIVLYPEKHSWCQITPIQQVVASPGYDPVTIDNNVCVGACYSYSIPKTQPAEPGELIGPYCDSCQPSEMQCYHVNLKRSNKVIEGPKLLQKKVQIITNCSCQSCDTTRKDNCEITDENTVELPQNMFTEEKNANKLNNEDLPELLEANNTPSHHTSENDIKFKNKLKKWFELSYENSTYHAKSEDNYVKISDDLENFAIEDASRLQDSENDIQVNDLGSKPLEANIEESRGPNYQHHSNEHHNHHLGEEQIIGMNVVHLVKGPHGSMVAAPVEAKFQIDSDALKPNSEGIVINYESHHNKNGDLPNLGVTIPLRPVANSSDGALPQCKGAQPTL